MNSRDGWLRSPRSVVLLLAALVTALVMGAAFLSLRDLRADAVALHGEPLTDAQAAGQVVGDGSFGGLYQRPDEEMLRIWQTGVEEVRELLESGWRR